MNFNFDKLKFSFSRSLVLIKQDEAGESGLACLAMVADYHGISFDLDALKRQHPQTSDEQTPDQLVRLAKEFKLVARPVTAAHRDLRSLSLPCILQLPQSRFVVLARVGRKTVTIYDPASSIREVSLRRLASNYQGMAFELAPDWSFVAQKTPERVQWRSILGKVIGLKRSLGLVAVLAVFIELISLVSPLLIQLVTDHALVAGDKEFVKVLMACFLLLLLVRVTIEGARSWTLMVLSASSNIQWMGNVFNHLIRLPLSYFEKHHVGDIFSRFAVISHIQNTLTVSFVEAALDGLLVLITLGVMLMYSLKLSFIGIGAAAGYFLLRTALFTSLRLNSRAAIVQGAKQQSLFVENIRGIQSIRGLNRTNERFTRWINLAIDQKNAELATERLRWIFKLGRSILFGVARILLVGMGALAVLDGDLTVGMLLALLAYQEAFVSRISSFIDTLFEIRIMDLQGSRLGGIVLQKQELNVAPKLQDCEPVSGLLDVRDMRCRYSENSRFILDGLTFKIKPGEFIGLSGWSSSGKTTLLKCLLGMLPFTGNILLGGFTYRQMGLVKYREHVAGVISGDQLFAGTLTENIASFSLTPDHKWIIECAKMVRMHDEIMGLPLRYNTRIGDLTSQFSTGQTQRLLVARALYKRPKVLLLDEALSQVRMETEQAILSVIKQKGISCLVVSRRADLSKLLDREFFIEKTKLVEKPLAEAKGSDTKSAIRDDKLADHQKTADNVVALPAPAIKVVP